MPLASLCDELEANIAVRRAPARPQRSIPGRHTFASLASVLAPPRHEAGADADTAPAHRRSAAAPAAAPRPAPSSQTASSPKPRFLRIKSGVWGDCLAVAAFAGWLSLWGLGAAVDAGCAAPGLWQARTGACVAALGAHLVALAAFIGAYSLFLRHSFHFPMQPATRVGLYALCATALAAAAASTVVAYAGPSVACGFFCLGGGTRAAEEEAGAGLVRFAPRNARLAGFATVQGYVFGTVALAAAAATAALAAAALGRDFDVAALWRPDDVPLESPARKGGRRPGGPPPPPHQHRRRRRLNDRLALALTAGLLLPACLFAALVLPDSWRLMDENSVSAYAAADASSLAAPGGTATWR